jgi:hypothetical protein
LAKTDQLYTRLHTLTVNSEWLPGYNYYMHTYISTYAQYVYTYVHTYVYIHTYVCVYIHVHAYVCTYTHKHATDMPLLQFTVHHIHMYIPIVHFAAKFAHTIVDYRLSNIMSKLYK